MQGWKIFTHSMQMVFGNLGAALRISGLLYLIYIVLDAYMMLNYGDEILKLRLSLATGEYPTTLPDGLANILILNVLSALITSLWISVLWHRYVLLEESPAGFIPPLNLPRLMAYFLKTIQFGLLLAAVGAAVGLILGLILASLIGKAAAAIVPLLILGAMFYLSYRFGLVLPAAALKEKMTFADSWGKTKSASGAIAQLAGIAIVFIIIIQIPSNLNPDPNSIINLVYSYVLGWIAMMVSLSVLNTLYGIYAEGRELS